MYFRVRNCDFYAKITKSLWEDFVVNLKRQKKEQGKTKGRILSEVSPQGVIYVDHLGLKLKYAKTRSERQRLKMLLDVLGRDDYKAPRDMVNEQVLLKINNFHAYLPKKIYFQVRDCILQSHHNLLAAPN